MKLGRSLEILGSFLTLVRNFAHKTGSDVLHKMTNSNRTHRSSLNFLGITAQAKQTNNGKICMKNTKKVSKTHAPSNHKQSLHSSKKHSIKTTHNLQK
jgi:hypothetical protein